MEITNHFFPNPKITTFMMGKIKSSLPLNATSKLALVSSVSCLQMVGNLRLPTRCDTDGLKLEKDVKAWISGIHAC